MLAPTRRPPLGRRQDYLPCRHDGSPLTCFSASRPLRSVHGRYTKDPGPVIAELRQVAGSRLGILAMEAGSWSGFYEDENTRTLARALLDIPGATEWVAVGQERRQAGRHSTEGFAR